jgi:hypothetical protein
MGTLERRSTLFVLVVLPDGSRSLIPATWTDWNAAAHGSQRSQREPCLASLTDLLHARAIVDALVGRCLILQVKPATDEESHDATDARLFRTSRAGTKASASGAHHRPIIRGDKSSGGNR